MKINKCIFLVVILIFLTAFLTYSNEESYMRMDNSAFDNPQRPAALFDHDIHNEKAQLEYDCALCHHVYEDGKLVEGESSEDSYCSDCHGLEKTIDNPVNLRKAFHKRCIDCHFEVEKGPVLCGECHKK